MRILTGLLCLIFWSGQISAQNEPSLIPYPAEAFFSTDSFNLSAKTRIIASAAAMPDALRFAEWLNQGTGSNFKVESYDKFTPELKNAIIISASEDVPVNPELYKDLPANIRNRIRPGRNENYKMV
ncbi:MAG: hypothetical protein RL220_1687, partial [Bacteroidota bacterium]